MKRLHPPAAHLRADAEAEVDEEVTVAEEEAAAAAAADLFTAAAAAAEAALDAIVSRICALLIYYQ